MQHQTVTVSTERQTYVDVSEFVNSADVPAVALTPPRPGSPNVAETEADTPIDEDSVGI